MLYEMVINIESVRPPRGPLNFDVRPASGHAAGRWEALVVSPTVLRKAGLRFYFFSREEPRLHVHVQGPRGEAKFWLEPEVGLAQNYGLSKRNIVLAIRLIREHEDEIRSAWKAHFRG